MRGQLRSLETRKRKIDRDLKGQQEDTELVVHPSLPDLYRRKVDKLHQVLNSETTRSQAVEILRSLIERIEIHPGRKRGQCEVVVVGVLARILTLGQQKTTAALGGGGTFLMVAGRGFEPLTFRL